ncbi:hypothetical protein N7466_009538 [Penicillium verhagenii]|uniref:uncharacterized protein n=1 Tax=Penicillium verhagenii TaxID=1562060 RepID=UPI002544FDBF|nr:uncharacterized protein N7466_009538 [Penicillium verhagenii]KAJ5921212.1 hypothetical protein N7466_009538 [Penicillium verhagenii]
MSENIDLGELRSSDFHRKEADALRILSEAFASQPDPAAASAELVRSIREYCSKYESSAIAETNLFYFWMMILNAQRIIPMDHPWHEALIAAVDDLRRQGGPLVGNDTESLWEDLPGLHVVVLDFWADPTNFPDTVPEEIEIWKRWNSLVSGFVARGCRSYRGFAYWEIRDALENDSHDEPTLFDATTVFECKLWVATQWLIRCGGILFDDLTHGEEIEEESKSWGCGPLCRDIPTYSIQRWDFWMSRLVQLADKKSTIRMKEGTPHDVVLSESSLSRVDQAIAAMHKYRSIAEARDQLGGHKHINSTG